MKPRTKEEKSVSELSSRLKPLTKEQERWAVKNSFNHEAWATKHTCTCMECGNSWSRVDLRKKKCRCPHCHAILDIKETMQRVENDLRMYFGIVTTFKNYQVFRLFVFSRNYHKGRQAEYFHHEAVQTWINEKGKMFHIARRRKPMSFYYDDWDFNSCMELKANLNIYTDFTSNCYPKVKYLNAVIRNGFRELDINPIRAIKAILSDNRMETLLKLGYDEIFKYFCSAYNNLSSYWDSLRVCIRRNYEIEEFQLWKDYIDFLRYLKKDLKNPKFVCPENLIQEHDIYFKRVEKKLEKERRLLEIQRKEEEVKRLAWESNAEEMFQITKSKYLNLTFTDGEIIAKPLQSVQEYLDEGNAMHHCVFTNQYYSKENTLIFSTTLDGERVETVEVSLETGDVIQCYGKYDKFTDRHKQVLDLMKANKGMILARIKLKNNYFLTRKAS